MSLLLRVALLPLGAVLYRVPIRRVVPRILCRRLVVQYNSRCAILNYHYTTINGLNLGVKFKNRFQYECDHLLSQHQRTRLPY